MNDSRHAGASGALFGVIGAFLDRAALNASLGEKLEQSLADVDEVTRQFPAVPSYWLDRSEVHHALKARREEAADLEKALRLASPDWPLRKDAERQLASLR